MKNMRPTGVTVIAILFWIGAAFSILAAIGTLLLGSFASAIPGVPTGAVAGAAIFGGIMSLAFAILGIFVGLGLWRGRNWARVTALILAILGALGGLGSLVGSALYGIVQLAIAGFMIWYLGFNDEAKAYFGASGFF